MNTRRLLFLSALCLTMGTTQVSAQSFLKKIKNKGTQIIKEAAPKPVKEVMDAVENSVLWEIPRDIMEELSDANGDIAYLYRSFFENSLMLSQLKADILRFESANDRYARLQQHFPEITRRAPLTMIASYLQMTLETLSRVRVSIANAESK